MVDSSTSQFAVVVWSTAVSNYGHPIRFGVELLVGPGAPQGAVETAGVAEHLGYDTVAFTGRRDDAAADAWTLASWSAAGTRVVRVIPRLDQAACPASVVARAAASLQLLSDGRAEVLLESGSEAEEIDALEDAVAVIRALLDTTHRSRVSHHGTHHRLAGAEPGPALDREVPLWVAGSHTSSAALAGRVADGWMVDLDGVDQRGFADLNAVLDRAAAEVDRDPREIRRAVVVAGDERTDPAALVSLVVEHGVSTFVLRIDSAVDPDTVESQLRVFISEVAPAVLEGAERLLPAGALSSRPLRRAEIRARRRDGVAYDDVPDDLAETVVEPGDAGFATVRSTYLRGGNPGLVLRPTSAQQVASAIAFAREHRHLPLGIRSGGHGISGRSGDYGGVGVGGLATAGGIGFLGRKHGLTIDHLRAVEMVLADGRVVRASETENSELFWASRGAGANFGVATAFEFVVDEVTEVGWAQLAFEARDPAAYLEAFGHVAIVAPRETTPFLILGRGVAQLMAMVDSTEPDVIIEQLQPFARIAPLVQQQVVIAPYASVMNMFPESPHSGRGEPVSRSASVREITPAFAAASADLINSGAAHWYQIRTVGGAVSDVAADATAYAHRDANFSLAVMGSNARQLDHWFEPVRRQSDGLYLSFESDSSSERIADAFPPATLERLRRLKSRLDPDNLFQDNFNVTPDTSRTAS